MVEDFIAWYRNIQLRRLRRKHITTRHPFDKSTLIEKHRFEHHPNNDEDFVYSVALMRCNECGLHWLDEGFSFRNGADAFLKARS